MLPWLGAILIAMSLGLGVIACFPRRQIALETMGCLVMAYPVGLAVLASLGILLADVGFPYPYPAIAGLALVGLIWGVIRARHMEIRPSGDTPSDTRFLIIASVVLFAGSITATAYLSAVLPETGCDSMGIWTLRARMIAYHDGDILAAWREYLLTFTDRTKYPAEWPLYPAGWPFVMSWVYHLSGGIQTTWAKTLNLVNWLFAGLSIMLLARRRLGSLSLLAGALFVLAPLFHSQAFAGYAELPMILMLFGAFYLFTETEGYTRYVLPGLLLVSAGFIKDEGFYFAFPVAVVMLFDAAHRKKWLAWLLLPALFAAGRLLLWGFDQRLNYDLPVELFDISIDGFFPRLTHSASVVFRALFLHDSFGIVPHLAVLLPILLIPFRPSRIAMYSVAIIGLYLLAFIFMGALSPNRVFAYYDALTVVERFCMNTIPYLCYLVTTSVGGLLNAGRGASSR